MCQSKVNGGQRCASHARPALVKAEKAYADLAALGYQVRKDGSAVPADLVEKVTRAEHAREDALVIYASTKSGESDLRARAKGMSHYRKDGDWGPSRQDIEQALAEGLRLRVRNARIKAAVKAGTMTKARAEAEAAYPPPGSQVWRQRSVDAAIEALSKPRPVTAQRLSEIAPATPHVPRRDPREALAEVKESASPQAAARIAEIEQYYERYDAMTRQALTPEGKAELEARLEQLPKVGRGYHAPRSRNPSHAEIEAQDIAEVLDDVRMGVARGEAPRHIARHRADVILAAVARIDKSA